MKLQFLFFIMLGFSTVVLGQLQINIEGCSNIAVHEENYKVNLSNGTSSYNLELQIAEGVWTCVQRSFEEKADIKFISLKEGIYRVKLMYKYSEHLEKKAESIKFSNIVVIKKCSPITSPDLIHVSPNPSTDKISITYQEFKNENEITVSILDFAGKLLQKEKMTTRTIEIPVTNYNNGLYIVVVADNDAVIAQEKIIINH